MDIVGFGKVRGIARIDVAFKQGKQKHRGIISLLGKVDDLAAFFLRQYFCFTDLNNSIIIHDQTSKGMLDIFG